MVPEVSVILPYYNAEYTLARAVESILNQTFSDFELLLVDNNSTDKSPLIAEKYFMNDKRVRLLKEPNQGIANAMNCGLQNAKGKFFARMDADDVSMPERLEKQVLFLIENPESEFIGSMVKHISHNQNTAGFARFVDWSNSFHSAKKIEINRFVEIPVVNPTIFFRREIYEKFGGCLHGDFPEDYEMQLRYLEAGVKMAKVNEPLLDWYDYSTRLTRNDTRYSTEAFFRVKAKYFKKWSEKNNPFHPVVWIWGAGRKTRKRANYLEIEGLEINGFIDIVKSKTTLKKTIHFTEIPDPGQLFVVSMVLKKGARKLINDFLLHSKYIEGRDFVMMG